MVNQEAALARPRTWLVFRAEMHAWAPKFLGQADHPIRLERTPMSALMLDGGLAGAFV